MGRRQPYLRYSHHANTCMRVIGYLNAVTGAVHSHDTGSVTAKRLAESVSQIAKWYPDAEKIYLVWDNWFVHLHDKVANALEKSPRVEVLPLPTYAPWLNPIEKLWRWLRQRLSHTHPWSDDFLKFRDQVRAELAWLSTGHPELLRYVGLSR